MENEHTSYVERNSGVIFFSGSKAVVGESGELEDRTAQIEAMMTISMVRNLPAHVLGGILKTMVAKLDNELSKPQEK